MEGTRKAFPFFYARTISYSTYGLIVIITTPAYIQLGVKETHPCKRDSSKHRYAKLSRIFQCRLHPLNATEASSNGNDQGEIGNTEQQAAEMKSGR